MQNLFVYGTLLDPWVQQEVIGRTLQGVPDQLVGYRIDMKTFTDGVYPTLVLDPKGRVEGKVITIQDEWWPQIDDYEGAEYRRIQVKLVSGVDVWTYIA